VGVKSGIRALGVAESFRGREGTASTLCGAVLRASQATDGFTFGSCTVGGTDATEEIATLTARLDREDVRYVLVSGLALAWYNLVDLRVIAEELDRPCLSITFEGSDDGLEAGLREAFSGAALDDRLETYRRQPPRRAVDVGDGAVFVRSVGLPDEEADDVVQAFTPEGGRPEPLRVARLAARAADRWRSGEQ
jgi:endonuclease V-like protein UPF0215 family